MKTLKSTITLIVLSLFAQSALAQLSPPTPIEYIQMPADGHTVYVRVGSGIVHDDCVDPNGANNPDQSVYWLYLRKASAIFDEIYARVLIAESQGDLIQVYANQGSCHANGKGIVDPYIRF